MNAPYKKSQPLIRGTAVRFFCSSLENQLGNWRDEVYGQIGVQISSIRNTPALSWFQMEDFADLNRQIYEIVGREDYVHFYRRHISTSTSHPIYTAFLSGLLRLLGKTPGRLIRYLNRGYAISLKNCGKIQTFEDGPSKVIVQHSDLPTCMQQHDWSSASLEGTVAATLDICEVQGTVEVEPNEPFSSQITVHLTWVPK